MTLEELSGKFPLAAAKFVEDEEAERREMGDEYEPLDPDFDVAPTGEPRLWAGDGFHSKEPWIFRRGQWRYWGDVGVHDPAFK